MSSPASFVPSSTTPGSREQLMLEAIRWHMRHRGGAPSYRELGIAVGIKAQHVGKVLRNLQRRGFITVQQRGSRSIELVNRAANLSDLELEAEAIARGFTITRTVISAILTAIYMPGVTDEVTKCGMVTPPDLADLLDQLDGSGGNHGQGDVTDEGKESRDPR